MASRETYRKVITSPELIEQINPKNKQLADRFLKNYSTKRSPKTIKVYQSNLNIFFVWNLLNNENMFYVDIHKYELIDFFDYCVSELKWGSQRYNQMHACLSSFSTWIENIYDEKYPMFRNLLPKIEKLPKEAARKKSVFKKEDLDRLMDWLKKQNLVQEQCLLALMVASGARASEIVRFTTSLIDENNTAFDGLFLETTEEMQVKGRGVHGKHIYRYILKDVFLPYYKAWLPVRKKIMEEYHAEHDYVFITNTGTPASVSTLRNWMQKWDSVLDQHIYIHSLRHYWTTTLLSIGLEKELVQELQAWSSDALVDLYNDEKFTDRKWVGLDKLRSALKKDSDNCPE